MTKRILPLVLAGVMIISTGCGLSSGTKDRLFGDPNVTEMIRKIRTFFSFLILFSSSSCLISALKTNSWTTEATNAVKSNNIAKYLIKTNQR
mgnify:CR=1 FL=1